MNPVLKETNWPTRIALVLWIISALSLLVILARIAFGYVPPITDLNLLCSKNPASQNVLAYRFYERINNSWVFLGESPTNGFRLTNVVVIVPHTYGVSASNDIGESDISTPYISPTDPHPPLNLHADGTNALVLEASFNNGQDWRQVAIITNSPAMLLMQRNQMFRSSRTNLPPLPQ